MAKVTRKKASSKAAQADARPGASKTGKAKSGKAPARRSAPKSHETDEPVRREVEIVDNAPFEENEDLESDPNEKLDEEAYEAAKQIDEKLLSDEDLTLPLPPPVVAAKTARKVDAEVIEPDNRGLKPAADPIATYLAEIRRYPLLTKEQEHELAIRYRETGDAMAAERLVTSNLRFVVKIAAEYSRFGAKLIDLVQEGNVGLMHAVKEFNPYKGVRLITYAVWWIRGYIQEYLMRQYSLVRIGTTQNQRKLFYRLQKEQQKLNAVGREPDYALLAGRLGVTPEEVETMTKRLSGRDVSLSAPVDDENPGSSLLDFEEAPGQAIDVSIGNEEELTVLRQNIEKIRDSLSEKELYILSNRILSDEPQTLQEIGEHYGVTREAVRQLEARLIGKIRKAVTSDLHYEDTED